MKIPETPPALPIPILLNKFLVASRNNTNTVDEIPETPQLYPYFTSSSVSFLLFVDTDWQHQQTLFIWNSSGKSHYIYTIRICVLKIDSLKGLGHQI
jgi:hypothetical protein